MTLFISNAELGKEAHCNNALFPRRMSFLEIEQ